MVSIYPDIEAAYLSVIKSPMDLTTLADYLHDNSLIDEEDYYEKVLSIFQNAVDFNSMKVEEENLDDDEDRDDIDGDEKIEKDGKDGKDGNDGKDGKDMKKDKDVKVLDRNGKEVDKEVEKEVEKEVDPLVRRLVSRSAHMATYAKWLCLEALPVVADRDRENR